MTIVVKLLFVLRLVFKQAALCDLLELRMICFYLFCFFPLQVLPQEETLDAIKVEADRSLKVLKEQPIPAYYISYRVQVKENYSIISRFGKLQSRNQQRESYYNLTVRVGSNEMDNTRKIEGNYFTFDQNGRAPIEYKPFALKMILWEATNKAYMSAIQKYECVKAISTISSDRAKSGDFTRETPDQYYEEPISFDGLKFDTQKWEEKVKIYSLVFGNNKDLVDGTATLNVELIRKYFVDTDGAVIAQNSIAYRLLLTTKTIADDGMELPVYKSYFGMEEKHLPSDTVVIGDAQQISILASRLKNAPVAASYSGPAILSPKVSAVFFHEILGHRIEGSRLKQETDAQTFKDKLGEKVLSEEISVIYEPQLKEYEGIPLSGNYVFDDEGVRGQQVNIIENGILKSFLMSRIPIDGFQKSNGHGRGDIFRNTETRQSNMIIKSSHLLQEKELRKMLIDEIKRSGNEYGYLFDEVIGGFTNTERTLPNAFNVTPLVVYRIYANERPDELVRGVNLIGTPLTMLSQIVACGSRYDIFNGYCDAPSGMLPVSCVAPSLFIKKIETQKKSIPFSNPPLLERPL